MTAHRIQLSLLVDESYNVITPDNVKRVLLDRFQHTNKMNPLEYLAIIDQLVSKPTFPQSPYGRRFALTETLILIITRELTRHRQTMELPSQPADVSISHAFTTIVQDGQTYNSELIGWSWLYYRCVRIEFGIQQNKFCEVISLDDRTIRRYQDNTIRRIVDILIDKERKARQQRLVMKLNKNEARLKYWRRSPSS